LVKKRYDLLKTKPLVLVKAKSVVPTEKTTTSIANIREVYNFNPKIIGCGQFGTIRTATLILNPKHKVAVKTLSKDTL